MFVGGNYSHNYYVRILNNEFYDSGANAVIMSNTTTGWVGNNDFLNNHWDNQFSNNAGGQILLEHSGGYLEEIAISGNTIENTLSSSNSCGIEMAAFSSNSLEDLEIQWNVIKDHNNRAIYFNTRESGSDVSEAVIRNNTIHDNDIDIRIHGHAGIDVYDNLHEHGTTTATAEFTETAKTCTLAPGATTCTIRVKWTSENVSNPRVYVRGTGAGATRSLFSSNANWEQDATWINTSGAIFELVSGTGTDPYASINVKAVP